MLSQNKILLTIYFFLMFDNKDGATGGGLVAGLVFSNERVNEEGNGEWESW